MWCVSVCVVCADIPEKKYIRVCACVFKMWVYTKKSIWVSLNTHTTDPNRKLCPTQANALLLNGFGDDFWRYIAYCYLSN